MRSFRARSGLGLIVTEGFRYILEIARQSVPEGYGNSYFWVKPERIVPLRHVREVGGRLEFLGAELRPLDEASMREATRYFREAGIGAIGVCLMHAYANAAHERRAAEIVAQEYPDCTLSLSCDVLPEYREYERAVTTLVDAFIKPHMSRYLARIREELGARAQRKAVPGDAVVGRRRQPRPGDAQADHHGALRPAAGALGSAVIAEIAGFPDLVTLDAGGTSTDLCLIEAAKPKITNGGRVGRFPVRIPMLDVKTIGTGGGSIAWITREGKLKRRAAQRRRRAGADVLSERRQRADHHRRQSRSRPHSAGADRRRHPARCRTCTQGLQALAAGLPGNLSAEQLAEGIIEIANWDQANAIRQMTIQRGIDPGAFALLSFGGSGPAQSPAVMELMGMKTCIVPPNPGNLSAFGLLAVDWRTDHIVTKVMHEESVDLAALAAIYGSLEKDGIATLEKDGIAPSKIALLREADVRYAGQSMEVRVLAPAGKIDAQFVTGLIDAFHAAHRKTFGYNYAGQQKVELVNFCVSAFGMIDRPSIPELVKSGGGAKAGRPAGLFRRQVPRHAGIRARLIGGGLYAPGPGNRRGIRLDHGRVSRSETDRRSSRHPDRQIREELGRYLLHNAHTPDDFFDPHHGVPVAQTRRDAPDPPPFRGRWETAAGFCIDETPRVRGLRFSPPKRGRDRVGVSVSKELFRVPQMMNVHSQAMAVADRAGSAPARGRSRSSCRSSKARSIPSRRKSSSPSSAPRARR